MVERWNKKKITNKSVKLLQSIIQQTLFDTKKKVKKSGIAFKKYNELDLLYRLCVCVCGKVENVRGSLEIYE